MTLSPSTTPLTATVLITTKDRRELLARAIDSVLMQTVPVELLVVDDGSTDGTAEMVAERYPSARLIRNPQPLGIIAARNAAAELATGDILFTLDDDAAFRGPDLVETVLAEFAHPRVGVVAIPYDNHHPDGRIDPFPIPADRDSDDFYCMFPYPGGSNALRLKWFIALGGYSGADRQSEEPTYAIRLLDHGLVVRTSSRATIDHYPQYEARDHAAITYAGSRNAMRFAWKFVPWRYLPGALAGGMFNRWRAGYRRGLAGAAVRGLARGMVEGIADLPSRRAVSPRTYRLMRQLTRQSLRWSQIEGLLDQPRELSGS
jgi:glycosyltransferase involved in cell wall biosynthesis